jgi:hypothetical protein
MAASQPPEADGRVPTLAFSIREGNYSAAPERHRVISGPSRACSSPTSAIPLLARSGCSAVSARTSAVGQKADLRAPMSGFHRIASASGQRADPALKARFRRLLTLTRSHFGPDVCPRLRIKCSSKFADLTPHHLVLEFDAQPVKPLRH